ncbi:mitochondrial ribosomal protein s23 domain-containing protein [Ditylenchus destructor]|uniref:Small ribosomal subunit protein mS23 n=1 Tax=Ditylenchus destructor TaxID=166010 RepID=A0AAD4RAS6_9BILA|nr:mitochondrial ribosomal protein s23 domain-containing protein [Ditylenchus destructor]
MNAHIMRLHRMGNVFRKVEALLKSGQMKHDERPLWYDAYLASPPLMEPQWDRRWPKYGEPVRQIFYPEDEDRAKRFRLKEEERKQMQMLSLGIMPETEGSAKQLNIPSVLPGSKDYVITKHQPEVEPDDLDVALDEADPDLDSTKNV